MLLWTPDHLARLTALIGAATRIVIGTGNLGTGAVVKAIGARAKAGVPVAITTGCGGGTTRQHAVTWLRDDCGATVRVVDDRSGGLFHAKVYAFALPDGDRALVGSANLSGAGFGQNNEVMVEVPLALEALDSLAKRLGSAGVELTDLDLLPALRPMESDAVDAPAKRLDLAQVLKMTWPEYVRAIRQMDRWWSDRDLSVLYGTPGWVNTLEQMELRCGGPLCRMSEAGLSVLVGNTEAPAETGDVGFLGDFSVTQARHVVLDPSAPDHAGIATLIDEARASVGIIGAPVSMGACGEALAKLIEIPNIAMGVASRLLTASRPDVFMPVNNGNRTLLEKYTGLAIPRAKSPKMVRDYVDLLGRIQAAPWYAGPPPSDEEELVIWRARAALLDIFVYRTP